MNLTIDVGNTCTKLVAFEGLRPVDEVRMDEQNTDVLHRFCRQHDFERGIYSTVVRLPDSMSTAIKALPFPMMQLVSGVTPIPIRNLYATPQTLGSDRLAAAVGAYCKETGHDVLVIDVGTCITYDFVNARGEYLGGNISPGPTLRIKALHAFTDKLPMIERKGVCPDLGNTTETAIRSGVMTGVRREIEGYIRDYLLKSPGLLVYLTGGVHLDLRISEKMRIFADDFIVPEGLNRILLYNEELNKQ